MSFALTSPCAQAPAHKAACHGSGIQRISALPSVSRGVVRCPSARLRSPYSSSRAATCFYDDPSSRAFTLKNGSRSNGAEAASVSAKTPERRARARTSASGSAEKRTAATATTAAEPGCQASLPKRVGTARSCWAYFASNPTCDEPGSRNRAQHEQSPHLTSPCASLNSMPFRTPAVAHQSSDCSWLYQWQVQLACSSGPCPQADCRREPCEGPQSASGSTNTLRTAPALRGTARGTCRCAR